MAKFVPFDERCKEKVKKQWYYTGSSSHGHRYGGCDRKAGPSGYCWQHAPARAIWDAAEQRRKAKKRKARRDDIPSAEEKR